jgi:hypothetical protein
MLNVKVKAFWRGARPSTIAAFMAISDAVAYAKLVIEQKRFSPLDCERLEVSVGRTLISRLYVPEVVHA